MLAPGLNEDLQLIHISTIALIALAINVVTDSHVTTAFEIATNVTEGLQMLIPYKTRTICSKYCQKLITIQVSKSESESDAFTT